MFSRKAFFALALLPLAACQMPNDCQEEMTCQQSPVHYVEIVTNSVDDQIATLETTHGLSFGEPQAAFGNARIATQPDGSLLGVRAPLAAHESAIVRTYFHVADVKAAAATAESKGGVIAYPPTQQGDTGTWCIYILDGVQVGLWQP